MLTRALLAVFVATRARQLQPSGLFPLTCNEIARLINHLIVNPIRSVASILHWSQWRRRHQTPRPDQPLPRRPAT
jgi:hypothetical protein